MISEITRQKMRDSHKGQIPWSKGKHIRLNPKGEFKKGDKKLLGNQFAKGNKPNKTSFKKGLIPWNKNKKGLQKHTQEWRNNVKERMEKLWGNSKFKEMRSGENHPCWKGGISFEPYPLDWTETLKRAIRERDNYICQLCSQYGNYIHHKDYNKRNCNPENLITLCKKCHSKTNHNREYWLKYFKVVKGQNK